MLHLGRLWPTSKILRLARKKFYAGERYSLFYRNVGDEEKKSFVTPTGQMLQNIYGSNLRIFVIARVFAYAKPFHLSLMFAVKTGDWLSKAPFRCSILG